AASPGAGRPGALRAPVAPGAQGEADPGPPGAAPRPGAALGGEGQRPRPPAGYGYLPQLRDAGRVHEEADEPAVGREARPRGGLHIQVTVDAEGCHEGTPRKKPAPFHTSPTRK